MGKQNDKLIKNMKLYEQKEKAKQQKSKVYGQKPVKREANKRKEVNVYDSQQREGIRNMV